MSDVIIKSKSIKYNIYNNIYNNNNNKIIFNNNIGHLECHRVILDNKVNEKAVLNN